MNKPPLTIDLANSFEANIFTMFGKAKATLEATGQRQQADDLKREFAAKVDPRVVEIPNYEEIKKLIAKYCNVTWLNDRK